MVFAYLSLLLHAFVPHHHHGGGTAFLNGVTCPHEQVEETMHRHNSHDHSHEHATGEDCETIKNAWIDGSKSSVKISTPAFTLQVYFLLDLVEDQWAIVSPKTFTKVPWLVGSLRPSEVGESSRRGPPNA